MRTHFVHFIVPTPLWAGTGIPVSQRRTQRPGGLGQLTWPHTVIRGRTGIWTWVRLTLECEAFSHNVGGDASHFFAAIFFWNWMWKRSWELYLMKVWARAAESYLGYIKYCVEFCYNFFKYEHITFLDEWSHQKSIQKKEIMKKWGILMTSHMTQ